MLVCEALSDAFGRFNDGHLDRELQRVDRDLFSDLMFFVFVAVVLFVLRTGNQREVHNPRQFYWRTAVRLGLWILYLILGFVFPLLYIRRKAHEQIFADLIVGTQKCRESEAFFSSCSFVCTKLQQTKLQISKFVFTPPDTLIFAYLFQMLWMSILSFVFRAMRHLPEGRSPSTIAELESILDAHSGVVHTSDTDARAQRTDCSICLEQLAAQPACRLSCSHCFHRICMLRWLQTGRNPTCPLCKAELCPS